jgi:hypothetical protein
MSVKESWYEMTTENAKEQEASISMFKRSKSSKKGPNEMAGITFYSKGATN